MGEPSLKSLEFDVTGLKGKFPIPQVADIYDPEETYAVGEYREHEGQIYKCKTAIDSPEEWTAAHWEAVYIADEIDAIKDALDALMAGQTTYQAIVSQLRRGMEIPNGLTFTVPHEVYGDIEFITRRYNIDKCADDASKPTVTIQPRYLLSANGGTSAATFQFDRPEAFQSVDTAIPAGTVCKFTTITYGSWAAGTYHFTATSEITSGSKLCVNGYQNTALTSLNVQVFANAKATSASATYTIESGDGGATVDLGTWGTDANHPQRVSYGSNNEAESNIFQFLNGSGVMANIWEPKTKYDMMSTGYTSLKGFLGGFPQEFRDCLGLASIHNVTNNVYESNDSAYTKNSEYTHTGYFWLPSRKEIYGSNETALEAPETQLPYFAELGTTDHDKLMYAKGAENATSYWLRTPYASSAYSVRLCYASRDGALSNPTALYSFGVAPLAILK